jgi:UPF0176 protein
MPMVMVATFYHLAPFADFMKVQVPWKAFMVEQAVTGTILVTPEGINGTIAGPDTGVQAVLKMMRATPPFGSLSWKISFADLNPFPRTKVKLKRETIPLGVVVDPNMAGTYVKAADWNDLIGNPDTIVVDTRNDYEVNIGQFKGALNPQTQTFKQLPQWLVTHLPADKKRPIAMYCTGGIRCEKSTAYLRQQGYENVFHLEGGILKYLEEVPAEQSLWHGDCYVFDDRVAVNHSLQPAEHYRICKRCNMPVTAGDLKRGGPDAACPRCR